MLRGGMLLAGFMPIGQKHEAQKKTGSSARTKLPVLLLLVATAYWPCWNSGVISWHSAGWNGTSDRYMTSKLSYGAAR